jgi:hypothetical protein
MTDLAILDGDMVKALAAGILLLTGVYVGAAIIERLARR